MGCCGDREKGITVTEEQKWDYITLSDFKSSSCLTPLSYAWLWVLVLISGGVYAFQSELSGYTSFPKSSFPFFF